jgi:hypothetical protein
MFAQELLSPGKPGAQVFNLLQPCLMLLMLCCMLPAARCCCLRLLKAVEGIPQPSCCFKHLLLGGHLIAQVEAQLLAHGCQFLGLNLRQGLV